MNGSKFHTEAMEVARLGRRALDVRHEPDGDDGCWGVQVIMPE